MARSFNQVVLMGNLTRDPELRTTPNGQSVCSFSLALNRAYKDSSGEWQELTDYVDITAWAGLAERVTQYLTKGRKCLVSGRLQSRSWEQDGQKRNKVEVVANDVTFLDSRPFDTAQDQKGTGDSPAGENSRTPKAKTEAPQPKASKKASEAKSSEASGKGKDEEVVIEDIGDEPINLDDIPF